MKNLFFLFLLLFFYTSCQIEDRHVQNVKENSLIYTAENGMTCTVSLDSGRYTSASFSNENLDKMFDNNPNTAEHTFFNLNTSSINFYPEGSQGNHVYIRYIITPPLNTLSVKADIKIKIGPTTNGRYYVRVYGVKDHKETLLKETKISEYPTYSEKTFEEELDIFNFFSSYKVEIDFYDLWVEGTGMTTKTGAYIRFYMFKLYAAENSSIYLIDEFKKEKILACYNDEYTPYVYIDENNLANNLLLINPNKDCASPKKICLKNLDGTYPSERVKSYCERMGVTDGILAFAYTSKS